MMDQVLTLIKKQFNERITFREKRPGIMQIVAPFYHEDGDMYDIFIEQSPSGNYKISDFGLTLMHLSYSFDVNSETREKILARTLSENGLYVDEKGNISLDAKPEYAYNAIMQYVQAISKISNMRLYKREVAKSEFFDKLTEFIESQLLKFHPFKNFHPIASRDDLSVDFKLGSGPRPLFLFGANSIPKARLITICCLEYLKGKIPFRSVVIHEDFESLNKNDRKRLTNVVDKQFTDLDDFRQDGMAFLEREAA